MAVRRFVVKGFAEPPVVGDSCYYGYMELALHGVFAKGVPAEGAILIEHNAFNDSVVFLGVLYDSFSILYSGLCWTRHYYDTVC